MRTSGFRSGTTRIELLVSLSIPKFVRAPANAYELRNRDTSAANPKFAQVCGALGCELRVQKRHYKDRVASVLIDSEVRTSAPQMLTNFGIGTLAVLCIDGRSGWMTPPTPRSLDCGDARTGNFTGNLAKRTPL